MADSMLQGPPPDHVACAVSEDDDDRRPPEDPLVAQDRTPRRSRSDSPHRPPPSLQILSPPSPDVSSTMALPSQLLPLLLCPACQPPAPLVGPVTLLCGHTVCSRHVLRTDLSQSIVFPKPGSPSPPASSSSAPHSFLQLAPCPLSHCPSRDPSSSQSQPNIPSSSRVSFIPAPLSASDPAAYAFSRVPGLRTDVTVSKLSALIQCAEDNHEDHFFSTLPSEIDDHTDSDDDDFHSDPSDGGHGARQVPDPVQALDVEPPELDYSSLNSLQSPPPSHARHRQPRSLVDGCVRPRKRRRQTSSVDDVHRDVPLSSAERFEKELIAELTCEICLLLMYRPVTTPCQHTFCSKCLQRSLDHSDQCPLCRHGLTGFAFQQDQPSNETVLAILLKAFPDSYAERGRLVEQEEHDEHLDTPIFVCQLSFPGMPTLLHFFEPRYRLMLRRCLESPNPCFGMVMPPRPTRHSTGNDFGTMLEIRSVRMLPDGRSMVETWGTHRFRIMERGTLDGYVVGRVERIDDYPNELNDADTDDGTLLSATPPTIDDDPIARALAASSRQVTTVASDTSPPLPSTVLESLDVLLGICHAFLQQLRQGAAPWVVQRLNHTYGPMPANASHFSFWMAMLLPIDEYEKAKLLPIKSPRLRLRMVVHWIEQLNSNWWFTSGCVIS